jgi:hypothetical protein
VTDRILIDLRAALDNFNRLSSLDLPDEAYDEVRAVLREYTIRQFRQLFAPGNLHLVRELARRLGDIEL